MTKKLLTLPIKLRFILGYLYFIVFSSSLVGAAETFGTKEAVFAGFEDVPTGADEFIARGILAVTSLATIGLAVWTIHLIHRRKATAGIAFILLNLVSYGLYTIAPTAEGIASVPAIVFSLVILAVDIIISLYLLLSKEAKLVLSK